MESLGSRLHDARIARGLTQAALAKLVGMSQQGIHDLEKGKGKRPRGDNLLSICRVLELSPLWLIEGKGERDIGAAALTKEESDLLAHFQAMPAERRDAFLAFLSIALAKDGK